eukprot:TRINITY_DN1790_c0_g4_i1.p1 TRINITY_DN1790_c0_g4~~TRINITY_DN1790_c0_g4_i1.p1  ORF type:complete len:472 (-),score=88.61 TRINITY_DN1790_c0_g4_i1:768-2183(-)
MESAPTPASRVIHFRQVHPELTESDFNTVAATFGEINKIVVLRNKGQALLQFAKVQSAFNFMQYYNSQSLVIRNHPVIAQFSNHQELNAERAPSRPAPEHKDENTPNHILLATILNPHYPITADVLHQVFSPFGVLVKVVLFQKSAAGLQALIQYQKTESAIQAKNQLNNQNIYPGCCTLFIQFSNLTELSIRFNNERSRDFTNPDLPSGEQAARDGAAPFNQQAQRPHNYFAPQGYYPPHFNYNFRPSPSNRAVLLVANLDPELTTCDHLFNIFSNYGNILRIKILHNKPDHALIQMADNTQASNALTFLKGVPLFGRPMDVISSKFQDVQVSPTDSNPKKAKDYSNNPLNRFTNAQAAQRNMKHICSPSNVLHVSNLAPVVEAAELKELLSRYGTVQDIKVFESHMKRQAFVQFPDVATAVNALVFSYGAEVHGRPIRVSFSSRTSVQSSPSQTNGAPAALPSHAAPAY